MTQQEFYERTKTYRTVQSYKFALERFPNDYKGYRDYLAKLDTYSYADAYHDYTEYIDDENRIVIESSYYLGD